VYKKNRYIKYDSSGQASVEYILLIVVIVSVVMGLLSFAPNIKGKIESQKMNLALKLSGSGGDLTRSDFTFKDVKVNDVEGSGSGGGGTGAGKDGKGGKGAGAGAGSDDDGRTGLGKKGSGRGGSGLGEDDDGGGDGTDELADEEVRKKIKIKDEEQRSTMRAKEEKRRRSLRSRTSEDESYYEEEEETKDGLSRMGQMDDYRSKEIQPEKMKQWNIFKFIIIIAVVFFFIVIILKARGTRD
jgi:Flp pilus assembly pilin Flp